MSANWGVWVALVALVLSHVFMFAAGVAAYHCIRWINMRPIVPKPAMSDQKLVAMAEQIARKQATADQFAWIQENQRVNRPAVQEQVEEAFAPSKK